MNRVGGLQSPTEGELAAVEWCDSLSRAIAVYDSPGLCLPATKIGIGPFSERRVGLG